MNSGKGLLAISRVNPVWWFVVAFILLLAGIALLHWKNFHFSDLHFVTFCWIGTGLVAAHVFLNLKSYREYLSLGRIHHIAISIWRDMFQYLPYLLMAFFYDNIPLFQNAVSWKFEKFDLYLMASDIFIFGFSPALFLQKYYNPYLVEFFMFSYTLFVLPYAFLMYLFQKKEKTIFNKMLLAQVIASIIALVCFILLPAKGPRHVYDCQHSRTYQDMPCFDKEIKGVPIDALFNALGYESLYSLQKNVWNKLERIKTDSFPSMHTTLYLLCLIFVVRYHVIMRWKHAAMIFWSVSFVSLVFSCVYLQYHWVIDIFAGVIVAFLSYMLAELIVSR